ncbi:MAG TPA: hypothetical protein VFT66_01605 [Roseiflexaceae bacterium]|nr:hypothetical protein [Roseiflexaceae bacterium]
MHILQIRSFFRHGMLLLLCTAVLALSACSNGPTEAPPVEKYPNAQHVVKNYLYPSEDWWVETFETQDSPEKVCAFFSERLPQHGWKTDDSCTTPAQIVFYAGHGSEAHILYVMPEQANRLTKVVLKYEHFYESW